MSAYVKQASQVVLLLTKAEALALNTLVQEATKIAELGAENSATKEARRRAINTLAIACEPGSRTGAAIS